MSDMLSVFTGLTIIASAFGVSFSSPGKNTSPSQRDTHSPVFLQEPPLIPYYVTGNKSVNLTWVAMNVCRIQIKCNGKKFKDRLLRVCGKSCRSCRTRTKTKIVTVADFPKAVRNITCRCRVWGKKAVRQSDIILVQKAFLRLNFGTVQLHHVVPPNTTVVLKCRLPYGSPGPNITWYKIGKPSLSLGHDGRRRIRLTSKKDLVIKCVQMGDSGEYQCVARNMAASREGPVIRLDVRENICAECQEHQWPCTNTYSAECQSGSNRSLNCGENRNKSGSNSPTDPSLVVVLLIAILVLVVLGLVISLFKERCPCQTSQDPPRMTRRSTNLDVIHDDDDESLELTDQTELERAVPDLNNESINLMGQESGEPSGSVAACGDSSVASPRGLVVYVTKVEVEQHGGVTVVGDDTKVHHHYSSQS